MTRPGGHFVVGGLTAIAAWLVALIAFAPSSGHSIGVLWTSLQWCGAIYVGIALLTPDGSRRR